MLTSLMFPSESSECVNLGMKEVFMSISASSSCLFLSWVSFGVLVPALRDDSSLFVKDEGDHSIGPISKPSLIKDSRSSLM